MAARYLLQVQELAALEPAHQECNFCTWVENPRKGLCINIL